MSPSTLCGDAEVGVDDVVGDGVQHDRRALGEVLGVGLELVPDAAQPGVLAVADGDDEVAAQEDHELARLDDLVGRRRRRVRDVAHRLEHREQHVVPAARRPAEALDLRALVRVHRVLDGQRVQPEDLGDVGDLLGVGLVQADPDEALLAAADLRDRLAVGPPALETLAVDVHRTVDDEGGQGHVGHAWVLGAGTAGADHAGTGVAQRGQAGHGDLRGPDGVETGATGG